MGLNIELDDLKTISTDSKTIKEQLTTDFKSMTTLLESICTNVNSSELTKSNSNLVQSINGIANSVDANLPKIINFLDQQVADYEKANAEAKDAIDILINSTNESN